MYDNRPLASAAVRYAGAWNEICSRISTRSNLNVYHIATIVALGAAHFSINDQAFIGNINTKLIPAAFMPIVSLIFVMWYRHNDLIIGALSAYGAEIERRDYETGNKDVPLWFYSTSERSIQFSILEFRKWSDRATQIICFTSPVLLMLDLFSYLAINTPIVIHDYLSSIIPLAFLFLFCISISCYLVYVLNTLSFKRVQVLKSRYDEKDGSWNMVL